MPFNEFNSLTGRLKESTKLQPLYPISPIRADKVEPPVIMFDSIRTKPVKTITSQQVAEYSSKIDPKMAANFKKFQDWTKPVYLLGGTRDKVFFGINLVLTGIGLCFSVRTLNALFRQT
ncbi:uncharacterized protein LOC105694777 [Orussus abietinus]|uniref:uncharacterized protein LOC105694777 n=1 Tax=Orussus abietinus TaxID=222816 RepID=UPI000625860A|nr:uncharacterized protein LOC105694777 [Orussus abietinus]